MTEPSTQHLTFVLERSFDVRPVHVYNAWATPAIKARWFSGAADWNDMPREID